MIEPRAPSLVSSSLTTSHNFASGPEYLPFLASWRDSFKGSNGGGAQHTSFLGVYASLHIMYGATYLSGQSVTLLSMFSSMLALLHYIHSSLHTTIQNSTETKIPTNAPKNHIPCWVVAI